MTVEMRQQAMAVLFQLNEEPVCVGVVSDDTNNATLAVLEFEPLSKTQVPLTTAP